MNRSDENFIVFSKSKPNIGLTHYLKASFIKEYFKPCSEVLNELHIWFKEKEGRKIGLFVPGQGLEKIKGSTRAFINFKEVISSNYSAPLDRWTISIYPPKKEASEATKKFIEKTGLSIVRNWIELKKTPTWFEGRRYLQIGLNEDSSEYCILEIQNNRIVEKRITSL